MKTVIGIDVGGSTTKIVGFRNGGEMIEPMSVRATDPVTSTFGAFGRFTVENSFDLAQIERVMVTGVGSSYISESIYGLKCVHVPEFSCIGLGGLYLSGLEEAIVVSMGTGTAITHALAGRPTEYLGGTGVGGGTLMGLAKKMLDVDTTDSVVELARNGSLAKVDLTIKDITKKDILSGMPGTMTASNFGKISDLASKSDLALGIINMVFETAGMMAIFASRNFNTRNIVLTGNLTTVPQAKEIFANLSEMFGMNFIIPERSQYATVIGAALGRHTDPSHK